MTPAADAPTRPALRYHGADGYPAPEYLPVVAGEGYP